MIELFAGSAVMASTFERAGFEVFTVDLSNTSHDPNHPIDLEADMLDLMDFDLPQAPHVVWASPPCTAYSYVRQKDRCFGPGGIPMNAEALEANRLVQHTLDLIKHLEPTYWFLENPRAYLGMQPFMQKHKHLNVAYCQYGSEMKKPTQIWGKHPIHWNPKPHCPHSSHTPWEKHPKRLRAILPQALCDEVVEAVISSKGAYVCESLEGWL